MINTNKIEEAKQLIKNSTKPIIIKAKDDLFNRKILEYGKFEILLDIESGERKRSLRNIDSGMNEFIASIAAKKNVAIGIDLNSLRESNNKDKIKKLEGIAQNIKLCRKAGAKIKIINYKDKKNALAFMLSLGSSTKQATEAVEL
ncbi:MAG: hypothetical protein AABY05_02960 [Nanoarchaeota archaeon]